MWSPDQKFFDVPGWHPREAYEERTAKNLMKRAMKA